MHDEEAAEAGADEKLFTEAWEEERDACDIMEGLCERENGLIGKGRGELVAGIIRELERRGGAEQRWSAPSPTPSMVNFATEKGSFVL